MREREVAKETRSHVSALRVLRVMGNSKCVDFRTIAHVTTTDQYRQWPSRVRGLAEDGMMCRSNAAARSSIVASRLGPPSS
jgi:hypothetical protein